MSAQTDPLVRSYAFCAKTGAGTGSVTALFVNLHSNSRRANVDVDIAGTDGRYSQRYGRLFVAFMRVFCMTMMVYKVLRPTVRVRSGPDTGQLLYIY